MKSVLIVEYFILLNASCAGRGVQQQLVKQWPSKRIIS